MKLINPDLTFNRSAIMTEAWRRAREDGRFAKLKGFGFYLRKAWAVAKAAKDRRLAPIAPEPAPIAAAPMSELEALLWGAQMIDSTRRSFAAQAAVRARFASLAA